MPRKSLLNQLELAHAPLTAYEFAMVKDDPLLEAALDRASLYVIGQRPVITFENVFFDQVGVIFEICQKGNAESLKCKLPLVQAAISSTGRRGLGLAFNFIDKSIQQYNPPFYGVHGFSVIQKTDNEEKFLAWFSPDKFLWNWWNEHIECEIKGDIRSFTKYKVHYVGKATRQNIIRRLSGHSTLQDILSLEAPATEKQLPANEIVILPFEFRENIQLQSFEDGSDINQMLAAVKGDNYPRQERVFLDVEKALIKAMRPNYNKELFKSYPVSKDGLYNDKYDAISYTFRDPITLVYSEGEIVGRSNLIDCDRIVILNNKEFQLIRHI